MNQAAMHVDADYRWRYVWVRVIGYALAVAASMNQVGRYTRMQAE